VSRLAASTAPRKVAVPVEFTTTSPSARIEPNAPVAVMFPAPELSVSFCAPATAALVSSCFSMLIAPPPVWMRVS
jgi:hypothetical protein